MSREIRSFTEFAGFFEEIIENIINDIGDLFIQYTIAEIDNGSWSGSAHTGLVDKGQLKQNLRVENTGQFSRECVSDVQYASAQNFGTQPFFPPMQPLKEWFMRKVGLDESTAQTAAYKLRNKIGKYGLPPKPYFTRGFFNTVTDNNIEKILEKNGFK